MHLLSRFVAAAGAGLAAAVLAGCGGNGSLLSSGQASKLSGYLTRADTALTDHDCGAASSALNGFNTAVGNLSGVNATLVSNLQQGVQTTEQLASTECPTGEQTTTSITTASTPTTTRPAHTQSATTTTKTSTHPQTTTTATRTQPETQTEPTQTEPSVTTTTSAPTSPTTTNSGGGGLTPSGTPGAE